MKTQDEKEQEVKETPAEKKAREEREKNETKEEKKAREAKEKAEKEEAERKERWAAGEPTDEDIAYERLSLLREAYQILVDHVTRLGGVGAPMGPLGDRFMAWLQRYNNMVVVAPVETDEEKKAREEAEKAAEREAENEGHPKIPKKEIERLDREEEEREKAEKAEPKPFKFK